jgi:Cu2+-exporting ATPase
MTAPLSVSRVGHDRLRLRGVAGETHAAEIMGWLAARPEVLEVGYRGELGIIEARVADEPSGAFVRTLEDWLFLQSAPVHTGGIRVAIVHHLGDRLRLRVQGGDDDDVVRLAAWLAERPGVSRASPSPVARSVLVTFDTKVTSATALARAANASDTTTWPAAPEQPKKGHWGATVATAAVLGASMSGMVPPAAMTGLVAATAIPSARRAIRALGQGRASIDLLDVAAVAISLATGQPTTAAFITLLLSVGDRILEATEDGARGAISKLMQLDAAEAWRLDARGEATRVSAKSLAVGDRILIEAGGRVAADGIVMSGEASVDEKALTGESVPRAKHPGDRILAATVVVEGQVVVEVDRAGGDTTAAKIVQILEGAGAKPMTLQRDVERVTDRMVLPAFGVAGLAAQLTGDLTRATSVLITDFGTGVRIAVPTAALTGMTLAARNGVLVKGAQYLERLSKTDVIVFDKTGTLTRGEPEVREIVTLGAHDEREVILLAASAEKHQAHPVAEAVRRHAALLGIDPLAPELGSESVTLGMGLTARVLGHEVRIGNDRWMAQLGVDLEPIADALERHRATSASSLLVTVDGELAAVLACADAPRDESARVIETLRAGGRRRVVLLSGDAKASVASVAAAVGADEAHGELLPEDKAAFVRKLQQRGHIVAMVGDGINDAPALALADVGISLEGGTDVALETADVVLLEGGLAKLPMAFETGDRAMASVKRGLALVIVPNAAGVALGALGLINPAIAAAINNGSTVIAALAAAAPLVLKRGPEKVRTPKEQGTHIVNTTAAFAAGLGAVLSPIPLADEIALMPIYAAMAVRIGKAHGIEPGNLPWKPILTTAGTGLAARAAINLSVSFVPGVAAVANAVSAAALTEIVGRYTEAACEKPHEMPEAMGAKDIAHRLKTRVEHAVRGKTPKAAE